MHRGVPDARYASKLATHTVVAGERCAKGRTIDTTAGEMRDLLSCISLRNCNDQVICHDSAFVVYNCRRHMPASEALDCLAIKLALGSVIGLPTKDMSPMHVSVHEDNLVH